MKTIDLRKTLFEEDQLFLSRQGFLDLIKNINTVATLGLVKSVSVGDSLRIEFSDNTVMVLNDHELEHEIHYAKKKSEPSYSYHSPKSVDTLVNRDGFISMITMLGDKAANIRMIKIKDKKLVVKMNDFSEYELCADKLEVSQEY